MASLPLVRLIQLRPALSFLGDVGTPCQAVLRRARLPALAIDDDAAFVPGRLIYRFLALASRAEGIPDLGARVAAETDLFDLVQMARSLAGKAPLAERLRVMARESARESSHMQLWLQAESETASALHYLGSAGPEAEGFALIEQYMLVLLVRFIRESGLSCWSPREVHLRVRSARELEHLALFSRTRFRLGRPTTAISISNRLLWSPGRLQDGGPCSRAGASDESSVGFLASLRLALAPYLAEGTLSLELGAQIAGLSPRTLQRRLAEHETSFFALHDRLRRDMALERLEAPSCRLLDVARDLGYSDHAHFTRAFRRWTGLSPNAYRRNLARPAAALT